MNIHYSSHMFHNVLLISFESLRKFYIIPGIISACFQQISESQNLYVLVNSKIFQISSVFTNSFIANCDHHGRNDYSYSAISICFFFCFCFFFMVLLNKMINNQFSFLIEL